MLVPAVLKVSTSPSPANVPPVTATVALVIDAPALLSLSATLEERITDAPFSVNAALFGTNRAGPSCRLTVVVCGALAALPSFATQVIVRVGLEPRLVGSGPDAKVTLSSTCW